MFVNGEQDVTFANACALRRRTGRDLFSPQPSMCFHPPDTVGRHIELHLLTKVQDGEDGRRHREDGKHDSENASLKSILHRWSNRD